MAVHRYRMVISNAFAAQIELTFKIMDFEWF